MRPQIIVCGLGCTGQKILSLLRQQGIVVVGVHAQPLPDEPDIIVGDLQAASTLMAAGIQHAHTLVLSGGDDGVNLAVLMQARVLNPRIRIINRLFNTSLGDRLDHTLPDHITLSVASLSAPIFAFAALGKAGIGHLRLFNQTWLIHEDYIDADHPWRGKLLSELWEHRQRMLIYYLPVRHQIDLVSAITQGKRLEIGDRLIIGAKPRPRIIQKSPLQRLAKFAIGLKYLQQHFQPLLGGTLLLFATILVTCLVYSSSVLKTPPLDALYFAVSLITGANGNDIGVNQAPALLKLFTIFTMLAGAAIIGISYALLNDFVLGTRFDRVWEAVHIPERHHFVVCGLGGVGMQIITHLHSYGYEVVAIEQDANCRFLSTVRSMGIPVIQGDASLPATLKIANLERAEALLAVTSNDRANLEIALNAKGLSPGVGAIVRYQDPAFARMAQQVFEFEAVLSPAELAAPAFAAAALGGRILGNGVTADSLWVALATLITPHHPLCGRQVGQAAMEIDFVPLYLESRSRTTIHGWDLLEATLENGDVLYMTLPANRLEQLWNTESLQRIAS